MCDPEGCGFEAEAPLVVDPEARRQFLQGALSLPLAFILADGALARAYASEGQDVTLNVKEFEPMRAYLALPDDSDAPTVILIHEWWGLNDQIKAVATEFAKEGYRALAVDLFKGTVATTAAQARELIQDLSKEEARASLVAAVEWAKTVGNGRVGSVGWCFGGGWSLQTALASDPDASVIYYGNVNVPDAALVNLNTPLLGHFATEDRSINQNMVDGFAKSLSRARKTPLFKKHWYEANHGFANPTSARYDKADTRLAWKRTLDFLKIYLKV